MSSCSQPRLKLSTFVVSPLRRAQQWVWTGLTGKDWEPLDKRLWARAVVVGSQEEGEAEGGEEPSVRPALPLRSPRQRSPRARRCKSQP